LSNVLEKLWELQLVMTELISKQKAREEKPPAFAAVDAEYQNANETIAKLSSRADELAAERRKSEAVLQDAQEALKKFQGQLMQVKNQQQYAAAWKEIDTKRKEIKELEDELLKKMAEIDEVESELGPLREQHAALQQRFEEAYQTWQDTLGEQRADVQAVESRAAAIESEIPDRYRNEFHQIFRQRQGIAVAKAESGACGACRFRLRHQAEQQARRGEIVSCEGCRRILYVEKVAS
jgi:uncharacterized protein